MYKSVSKFLQRKAVREESKKKRNLKAKAGNVWICSHCEQPQLEANLKCCAKCNGEIAKYFGEVHWGLIKFMVFDTFKKHLHFLKSTSNRPSKLNNLFLEIYPIGLWNINVSQNVYPESVKFVLTQISTNISTEKNIIGKDLFEGKSHVLATTKDICRAMFYSLCREINKVSKKKIIMHYI